MKIIKQVNWLRKATVLCALCLTVLSTKGILMGMTPIDNGSNVFKDEGEEIKCTDVLYQEFNSKVYSEVRQQYEINRINILKVVVKTSGDVQLRSEPVVKSSNVAKEIPSGTRLEVLNFLVNDEWYQVLSESGESLYVHKNYVYAEDASKSFQGGSQALSRGGYNKDNGNFNESFNVFTPSGLTISELYSRLNGSYKGVRHLADDAIAIEKQYGINALFTMSVAIHESGNGNSSLADSGNYFGIKSGGDWYRPGGDGSRSVYRFSEVIKSISSYKGNKIRDINRAYCPDGGEWTQAILRFMNNI